MLFVLIGSYIVERILNIHHSLLIQSRRSYENVRTSDTPRKPRFENRRRAFYATSHISYYNNSCSFKPVSSFTGVTPRSTNIHFITDTMKYYSWKLIFASKAKPLLLTCNLLLTNNLLLLAK